jgi:hypothetical protein
MGGKILLILRTAPLGTIFAIIYNNITTVYSENHSGSDFLYKIILNVDVPRVFRVKREMYRGEQCQNKIDSPIIKLLPNEQR